MTDCCRNLSHRAADAALLQCVQRQRIDVVNDKDLENLHDRLWFKYFTGRGFLYDDQTQEAGRETSNKNIHEDAKELISLAPRPREQDDSTKFS